MFRKTHLLLFLLLILHYFYITQPLEYQDNDFMMPLSNREVVYQLDYRGSNLTRSSVDSPDDSPDDQVHIMYVLPSDGIDEELDINDKITTSVTAFQLWFLSQTGNQILRLDTVNGSLDVTFHRLNRTNAEMMSYGAFVVTQIEDELTNLSFTSPNKKYAVYYGGGSTYACGGAAWPPFVSGQYAAMYLKAYPTNYHVPCYAQSLTSSITNPKYWEFAMLHDIIHTFGIVSPEAPNYASSYPAHVSDSPTDLMYTGTSAWNPSVLDYNNDDYYGHSDPTILDLKNNSFLQTLNITIPIESTTSQSPMTSSSATTEDSISTSSKTTPGFFFELTILFFLFVWFSRKSL